MAFDAGLRPVLQDEKGERLKVLPRGTKDDDEEKVKAAHALWTDLREDVSVIAARRGAGARQAMQEGHRWSIDAFRRVYLEHPLMKHLSRGILWEAYDPKGERLATFRVAEDGTFADVEDDAVVLDEKVASVGVAHPFAMTADARRAWREIFDDYEVIQPFAQVATEPPALTKAQRESHAVTEVIAIADLGQVIRARAERGWSSRTIEASRLFPDGSYGLFTQDWKSKEITIRAVDEHGEVRKLGDTDDVIQGELALALQLARDAV